MERGAIFVTGVTSGIGEAAARRLAAAGYTVIPGVRRPEAMPPGHEPAVSIDLADPDSIGPACKEVLERANGRLVGLVNNAGYTVSGPFEALSLEDWRDQFEVNFFGHLAITKELLPTLLANRGRIVNIGSVGGRFSAPFLGPYSASKFAIHAWSDALRHELAPHGVRVVLVEPGSIATEIWGKGNAQARELLSTLPPAGQARYAKQAEGAFATAKFAEDHAIPADKCAAVIEHALTAARPRGRYLVGADARVQAAVAILPTRLHDNIARLLLRQPRRA